ncbi:MAG: hypothetical protein DCC68_11335 [Planctomycetota bacterium]|nr:MAG: hypothetical protein DCC68_11335 [Planctomycetota bacterium]
MPHDPLMNLHPTDDGYTDEEWAAEMARRIQEVESGTAEIISWEEVLRSIQEAGERSLRLTKHRAQGNADLH